MNKVYIRDYSRKEIAVLIEECFYIIGKKTDNLEKFHIETMINGILKYQAGMQYDDFKAAFSDYAAGELDVDINSGAAPIAIGKIVKAWKAKRYPPNQYKPITRANMAPALDADYYDSLICVMEGKVSARRKMVFPDAKPPKGNEIPMTCNWEAVYRHLRHLKQVDEVEEHKQRAEVIKWLYIKYPNATMQADNFKSSPVFGTSLGQRIKQSLHV